MSFSQLLQGAGASTPGKDSPMVDSAETVYISSLALLKMLKHGRAGVPMEVMGLMLGEFVDDFTVRVIDVFAMPQSGTGVGCWLSGVDINTQQSFEQLNPRAVAVVVDPIQSVKGKVVIDAFRLINPQLIMMGQEPRQTTSNIGHLNKPSIAARIHGLDRHYYSIAISYRKNELEEQMLLNLNKNKWTEGLSLQGFDKQEEDNLETVEKLLQLTKGYQKMVEDEQTMTPEELVVANVGKLNAKKHLEANVNKLMSNNIVQELGAMVDSIVF